MVMLMSCFCFPNHFYKSQFTALPQSFSPADATAQRLSLQLAQEISTQVRKWISNGLIFPVCRIKMLDNMRSLLQASEEKKEASIVELTFKHHKRLESLEVQLGEAMSEKNRAVETISLQVLVAEKDSKIAEMDSASSGESARFKAAMKSVDRELLHQKQEHLF